MFNIFVGIVIAPQKNNLSIGIIKIRRKAVISQSFPVSQSLSKVCVETQQETDYSDLNAVGKFLATHISNPKKALVLIEIPSAFLNTNSIYIKLLFYLAQQKYFNFEFKVNKEHEIVQLGFPYVLLEKQKGLQTVATIPKQLRFATPVKYGLLYLQQDISRAYAQSLLGKSPVEEVVAVVTALIAANPSLYYFFTSEGSVHSSGDLVKHMDFYQKGLSELKISSVVSADEIYITKITPLTVLDRIDKIHLHYALAKKKNNFLNENDALKFALLAVCKTWKISLSCTSSRNDYPKIKSSSIYDPEQELDLWIKNALNKKL